MRPFALERPADASAALRLGAASTEVPSALQAPVQYLAGGTNLLDLMKLGVMRPETLVDITALGERFRAIGCDRDGLWLGALVTMAEAAEHPAIRRDYPAIAGSLWKAASPQLRNMASLGGNVLQRTRCYYFRDASWSCCNKRNPGSGCAAIGGVDRRLAVLGVSARCIASYPGDFAIALAALGAEAEILDAAGATRRIAVEDLHRLPGETPHRETNLRAGELVAGFRVPAGPWTRRSLYLKIRDRESYDFALASAAVALDLAPDGVVRTARIGIGGLATKPWRSHEAEAALQGRALDEAGAGEAAEAAFAGALAEGERRFKAGLGRRTLVRALLAAAALEI
jgi:xanthine dehydrogenase YagS FAD-binding subunit